MEIIEAISIAIRTRINMSPAGFINSERKKSVINDGVAYFGRKHDKNELNELNNGMITDTTNKTKVNANSERINKAENANNVDSNDFNFHKEECVNIKHFEIKYDITRDIYKIRSIGDSIVYLKLDWIQVIILSIYI